MVRILRNAKVETTPQILFSPYENIRVAPKDLSYYTQNLPERDKQASAFVVIPTAGIIAPIQYLPEGVDRESLISGREIEVNPYLQNGVIHYPNSAFAGELGNMILAGHSSYWKSDIF